MAGEAELDEPFVVEQARAFFEVGDAARVVLDQVVVGGEDAGDGALDRQGRKADDELVQRVAVDAGQDASRVVLRELEHTQVVMQQIVDEARMIALEVAHVQGRVERPEIFFDVEHIPQGAIAARDDAGGAHLRPIVRAGHARGRDDGHRSWPSLPFGQVKSALQGERLAQRTLSPARARHASSPIGGM
jgi:hypothetical protein